MISAPSSHRHSSPAGHIDEFHRRVVEILNAVPDPPAIVQAVRSLVQTSLSHDAFVEECVATTIDGMLHEGNTWSNPPLIDDDTNEFGVRLFFWPPGFANDPHEHTFWTVTGVFANELVFRTYAKPAITSVTRLETERTIGARRGEVGYIVPPCIHNVANESSASAISFHVFSGPKMQAGEYERGHTTRYHISQRTVPQPNVSLLGTAVSALVAFLDDSGMPASLDFLEQMTALPGLKSRLTCIKAIGRRKPRRAADHLLALAAECSPRDAARLERLGRSLSAEPAD